MSFYDVARWLVSHICPLTHPVRIEGKENLPEHGPYILCSNHISNWDPIMLAWASGEDIHFMAKVELFKWWPLSAMIKALQSIPVTRGANDMNAIRESLKALKTGNVLGIFPEGHRSKDRQLHEFMAGVGLLVMQSRCPVVPVKITSSYKLFQPVHISFGPAFTCKMTPGLSGSEQLKACTQLAYDRVSEL